jgi:hypothetical protein
MTNTKKRIDSDSSQLSLLDLLSQERSERTEKRPGKLCISGQLLSAVKEAIKQAPKSRETIADEMSNLTGSEITVHMINSWTSDSHPHRLPAEFLPALCAATNCDEPIRIMTEARGMFSLAGPDALRSELQKRIEARREIEKDIRKTETLIKALEGGK